MWPQWEKGREISVKRSFLPPNGTPHVSITFRDSCLCRPFLKRYSLRKHKYIVIRLYSFEKENETYQEIFSSTFSKLDLNPFQLTDNFAKHESKEAKLFR